MASTAKPVIKYSTDFRQMWKHSNLLKKGMNALLPEHYKKFYLEWKAGVEEPVHYIPESGRWKKNPETGEIQKVVNIPIPVRYPKEFHEGLWGGEGVIQGFKKRDPQVRRFSHFWIPTLLKRVVYSEILDKRFEVTCTERFLELVDKNYGFDNYILQTPPQDLKSVLALRFRRQMLIALAKENIYPDNPVKKKEVLEKYQKFAIPLEEAEWYGLTLEEAVRKFKNEQEKTHPIQPLKIQFRERLLEQLKSGEVIETPAVEEIVPEKKSWITSLNPFSKTS